MSNSVEGKIVCFTGRLTQVRRVARQELESHGGFFSSSISANTDIVVCGDDCGSKLDKAKAMGIEIWSEQDFDNAINNNNNNNTTNIIINKKKRKIGKTNNIKQKKKKRKLGGNSSDKPICKYGKNCFRKNEKHLNEFYHPIENIFDDLSSADDDNNNLRKKRKKININDLSEIDDDIDYKNELKLIKTQTETSDLISDDETDIRQYLQKKWQKCLSDLMKLDIKQWNKQLVNRLKDQNIVLTGWFPITRNEMVNICKKCHGKVMGIICDETQLLIVGQRPGNKLFDAYHQGIPLLYYTDLQVMLGISNRSNSLEL